MRFLIALLVMTIGATAMAQTPEEKANACYDFLRQKFPTEFPPGTTTGGTTTGGTTTGGSTTGGTTTGGTTTGGTTTGGPISDRVALCSMTHESGNLSQWNFGRQAIYDSGNARSYAQQQPFAHSGNWVLRQDCTLDGSSGARCFITGDAQNRPIPKQIYATTYLYLPTNLNWRNIGSWWNIQQFKERPSIGGSPVNPTLIINIAKDNTGPYLYIYNWIAGQRTSYNQSGAKKYLPLGRWIKLEWYVDSRVSGGSTWLKQDGVEIISRTNVKTLSNDNYVTNWSVDNYGDRGPGATTLYWDDCMLEYPR